MHFKYPKEWNLRCKFQASKEGKENEKHLIHLIEVRRGEKRWKIKGREREKKKKEVPVQHRTKGNLVSDILRQN